MNLQSSQVLLRLLVCWAIHPVRALLFSRNPFAPGSFSLTLTSMTRGSPEPQPHTAHLLRAVINQVSSDQLQRAHIGISAYPIFEMLSQ